VDFHTAGKQPNFLVGGVAENFGKSYGLGGGEEFILEGDEYETASGIAGQILSLSSR